MNMRLEWDGEEAWGENWVVPYPPRFLAPGPTTHSHFFLRIEVSGTGIDCRVTKRGIFDGIVRSIT